MLLGILAFSAFVAVAVFFFVVRGAEEIMVPDVAEKDIIDALLDLQAKELYPRLQMRYSGTASDRGNVLEQDPPAGTIVKAGRRIKLVVSQGVMINNLEDYRGRSVGEVQSELQTMFASTDHPQIVLKQPFMFEFSKEAAGTILQQQPEPGTSLSGTAVLEFVVSKGEENALLKTPNFMGLSVSAALAQIGKTNVDFGFTLRPVQKDEKAETVVAQNPSAGIEIDAGSRISLTVASPVDTGDDIFALFTYSMVKNPYPLKMQLDAVLPSGEKRTLLTTNFLGGNLTVPYKLPIGSVLVLSMLGRELYRETVSPPAMTVEQL
jgi:beta-lactam-binding protein with PASTA domain